MNALDFLRQYEKLSFTIEANQEKIIWLQEKATKTTVQGFSERVQSSGSSDPLGDAVAGYTDLQRIVREENRECQVAKEDIEKVLKCLPTAEYKVLYKQFVECKELYIIADEMNKSYSWTSKTKKRALKHVQEILDEREKR